MHSTFLTHLRRCLKQAIAENYDIEQNAKQSFKSSRRDALKKIGLGVSGMALAGMISPLQGIGPILMGGKKPVIAILGGGISGLHCAYVLQKAGLKAMIYEGSGRVGGRMYTLHERFGKDRNTEAGGEFLDSDHSDMLGLAREFNLPLLDVTADGESFESTVFHYEGKNYSVQQVVAAFLPMVDRILGDRRQCGEDFDTPFAVSMDNQTLDQYILSLPCEQWLQQLLIAAYVGEFGLDAGDQSAINFLSLVGIPMDGDFSMFGESDERYKVIGGNAQIVYKLADALQTQIKKDFVVSAIRKKGRQYQISFGNGQEIIADYVVCTLPYTIVRNLDLQIPDMSPLKQQCIKELGYGMNNKLLMGVNQRVWRLGARPTYGYLYDTMVHTGWDNSHMQADNQGGAGYTVFIGGTPSLELAAATSLEDKKRILSQDSLFAYLHKMDTVFGGFSAACTQDHEVITWSGNPWVKGSYACYKPGQMSTFGGKEGEPIGKNLLFAGEHCSVNFQGFMNGGAETGRLAAEEIIKQNI